MSPAALLHALREAVASIRRERRRLLPMALGIVFGMAFVMVLLAIADGFERSQRRALEAYGDKFVLLRLNRAELDRASGGKERRLQMDEADIERLRAGAPAIRRLSPLNMAYRAKIYGRTGAASNIWIAGALPELAQIRRIPLSEGRFFDDFDDSYRRRVIVLGPMARKQLFGNGPAVGQKVRISGFATNAIPGTGAVSLSANRGAGSSSTSSSTSSSSTSSSSSSPSSSSSSSSSPSSSSGSSKSTSFSFSSSSSQALSTAAARSTGDLAIATETFEVIGVLEDIETTKESYVSVARMAFVPFTTSTVVFDRRFITILLEPRSVEDRELALRQFRQVMGARYGFDESDRNAVIVYFDAIERARSIQAIFGGVRLFLAAVGVLILAIGGIGVMNVVLVSVAARTFEIGLRKALGATPLAIYTQFFLEAMLASFASGLLGFVLGAGGIGLLSLLPLPDGFAILLDWQTAGISFGILSAIAVLVGLYPARRAALLPPVEALQGRG